MTVRADLDVVGGQVDCDAVFHAQGLKDLGRELDAPGAVEHDVLAFMELADRVVELRDGQLAG